MSETYPADERAFLDAILADPDDDNRRLEYVDWLEERGDPRAEVVRAFVSIRDFDDRDPRRSDAHSRFGRLAEQFEADWVHCIMGGPRLAAFTEYSEEEVLAAIGAGWNGDVLRCYYGDWLENDGQLDKAEYVRAERAFWNAGYSGLAERREKHARMRRARSRVDIEWVARIARAPLVNCNEPACRTRCPLWWLNLAEADDLIVRRCAHCDRDVRYCPTINVAAAAHRRGDLIVLDTSALSFTISRHHPRWGRFPYTDSALDAVLPVVGDR